MSLEELKKALFERPKSKDFLRKAYEGTIKGRGRSDYIPSHEAMYQFRDEIESFLDNFDRKFVAFQQSEAKKKAWLKEQIKDAFQRR